MPFVPFVTVTLPKRLLVAALAALVIGGAAWLIARAGEPARRPSFAPAQSAGIAAEAAAVPGEPAPDFMLPNLQGEPVSLASLRGRPVIVYFWATWCHYCLETMPELQSLRQQHQPAGLEILAVNILESADKVRAHARRHGLTLPILLDQEGRVTQNYAVRATPAYYLIDRSGNVREILIGAAHPEELAQRLEAILSSEPSPG